MFVFVFVFVCASLCLGLITFFVGFSQECFHVVWSFDGM